MIPCVHLKSDLFYLKYPLHFIGTIKRIIIGFKYTLNPKIIEAIIMLFLCVNRETAKSPAAISKILVHLV